MPTGFGDDGASFIRCVRVLANGATALKAQGADLRSWLDRLSTGTEQEAADAVVARVQAEGGTISASDALLAVRATRELTFWTASFAPTYTLDVRGPSALL